MAAEAEFHQYGRGCLYRLNSRASEWPHSLCGNRVEPGGVPADRNETAGNRMAL